MAHGKLLTNAYLYTLNIGPNTPCNLCGLHPETMEHLFWSFLKILHCWQELFDKLGLNSSMIHLLNSGTRLWQIRDCWAKALIATITWLIWKQHCNLVFRNEPLNPNVIIPRPWSLCVEFSRQSIREYDFLWANSSFICIFIDASWSTNSRLAGLGFSIITNSNCI